MEFAISSYFPGISCTSPTQTRAAVRTLLGIVLSLAAASPSVAQRTQGLDLSSWQGNISQSTWNNIKNVQGKEFGFVRASRGATFGPIVPPGENSGQTYNRFDDPQFVNNITRGTNAGLLMGSYHFNRADIAGNTGANEANHYMETGFEHPAGHSPQYAGNFMRPGYLLPVFDLEAGSGMSTAALTAWANEFIDTIYNAKGFYPIVYTNSSYNNDEVFASVAWHNVDTGPGPHTGLKTYQWLARPSGNIFTGEPGAAVNYPNPYGVWDPNFNTRTNSRDPAINPWAFWQNGTFTVHGGANGSADQTAANGNIEFVKDFLVPALWTNGGNGDWSVVANWNSNNPLRDANPSNVAMGPTSRLPNNLDWVQLRNTGGGTITFSIGTHTIRKLTTQQPLNMTGGTLNVAYVPGSGGRDDIPSEFGGSVTISNTATYSAHTTQVNGGGGLFNVNGGTVTFREFQLASHASNSGKIVVGGDVTFGQTSGAGTSVIRSTGSLAQAGTMSLSAGNRTISVNNGSAGVDLDVRVGVMGEGRLVKSGAGTMQLSATNSYSGGTTISGGVLQVASDDRLGAVPGSPQSNNVILDGGTLRTGAQINSVSLTNAGSGYTSFPTLIINGAGGDSLAASANVLAGISSIAVTSGGSGYVNQTSAPPVNGAGTFVDIIGGGGTGATARAVVSGGVVTSIIITNPGAGYTSMPTIHISSTGLDINPDPMITQLVAGSGATASVNGITLQSIALNHGGFDYSTPSISLTGGGGTGATASATSTPNQTLNSNRGISLTANGGTLYQTANTTLTIGGVISSTGSGTLTKSGAGRLILTGNNSYTGNTTISAGVLQIGNGGSSGSLVSPGITNNAGLEFNRLDNSAYDGVISGSGTLSKFGPGTLTLSNNSTFSGGTTVHAGTLQIGNGGATGAISNAGGILNNGAVVFNRSSDYSYSGVISGTGSVTQTGNGTLTLSGSNSYLGHTAIEDGVLAFTTSANLGNASNNIIFDGGTLRTLTGNVNSRNISLNSGGGAIDTNGFNSTFSGVFSGSGSLSKVGAGMLTLTATNTATGNTNVAGGSLRIGNGSTTGSIDSTLIDVSAGASLIFNRSNAYTYSGAISGAGTVTKLGNGTLTLSGTSSYEGDTTINAGVLAYTDADDLGATANNIVLSGGTLRTLAAGTQTRDITVGVDGGTIHTNGFNSTFSGDIVGPGSLAKSGTGTLSLTGSNNIGDGVYVNAGALEVAGGSSASIYVGVSAAAQFKLANGTATVDTLDLSSGGGFDFTGGTLYAGTVSGDLTNQGGILAPGSSPGVTEITGNFTQLVGGTLEIEIGGLISGTEYDTLDIDGTATLGGILDVDLINGFTLPEGEHSFTILSTAGGLGGSEFSTELLPEDWTIEYLPNSVVLHAGVVVPPILPGDFNDDGLVNALDYVVWRIHEGAEPSPLDNDNTPENVGPDDYDDWAGNYTNAGTGTGSIMPAVPEPATATLVMIAVSFLSLACRRYQRSF